MPWSRNNRDSSPDQRKFTVYMNEGERDQINKWVQRRENIETGGDLFGAWIDDRTAVVQFVLGPGKECRRTGVSFFQDIDYLRNAGSYLTQKHGLCNIGQWHSHHRLGLTRPSGGDENTVWGNMPNLGLDRYIVIIATIPGSYSNGELTVNINPYLFEIKNGYRSGVIPGSFSFLERNSPFRMDEGIENEVRKGAEITNAVTIYPKVETETETTSSVKRPHENESDNKSANKIAKTEAEGMSHHMTQSLARNAENLNKNKGGPAEIPAGDGTGRKAEDVRNETDENGQFNLSQGGGTEENLEDVSGNDSEVSEQSNIGQNLENVPNKGEESKQSNISQDETTEKNQNIWNDNEISEQSNMEQGGATDRTPGDVLNKDEESKQSTILPDETTKNNQNIWNDDEVSELSNMEQGGATDITPVDVPHKDEESKQSTILQDEAKKKNKKISNEDEVSDQSNIEPGEAIERNPEKDPTQEEERRQFNTEQGDGIELTPKDVINENEESKKSSIPPEGSPNSSNKEENGQYIGQEGVLTEHAETRQLSILRDGSESNVQEEVDSMDVDDDHEGDSLSKGSEAESQIRDDNGIAFNSEGFKGTQSELSNFPNTESNPQKTPQDDSTIENIEKNASDKDRVKSNTEQRDEVFGDEQPKTPPSNVDSNQYLEKDAYNTSNHFTSTPTHENNQKQIDAADNNVQKTSQDNLETVETFEKHGSNNDQVELETTLLGDVPIDAQTKTPPNGEAKKKNKNTSNEEEVSELSNMEQGGATDITPVDVPYKDEESKQSTILQDEAKKKNKNISNEDEVSDQSNIEPGEAIERNPEKDPTQEEERRQFNTEQGDGIEQTPKDVINENEESKKSSIPPEGSPNSSNKEENGQYIGQEGVPTEHAETRQLSILRDGSESNVQEKVDSMDVDDDHEGDSLSKGSEAESQIRDDNGIAFNSEGFKGTQSELSNFPNSDSNPQKTPQDNLTIENIEKNASDKDRVKSNTEQRDEVFGDEQPKTPPNNVDSNQLLEKDSNNTSNYVTSTLTDENNQKQIDAADNNVQKTSQDNLETVETFEKHGSNNDQVELEIPLLGDVPTDAQSKTPPNDVSNNLDLQQDLNDTGKHVISISSDTINENQIDANDIINDQLSTSDTQERHDQDFLHDPKVLTSNKVKKVEANDTRDGCQVGQCGQLDILQKDTENYLKQNLEKDSLNHFPTKQHDYKTEEERTKNEKDEDTSAKKDGELDGAIADEKMPLERKEDQNSITGNSGFQKRRGELNEKEDRKLNSAQGCDKNYAIESLNIPVLKSGKRQSRSIFDSLEEPDEKQELTSNNEMHEKNFGTKNGVNTFKKNETNNERKNSQDINEADAKIETKDGVDTFTENEKNEGKDLQENKQSLPDPQSDESNKTTQIEKNTAKNNEVTTENSNKDGASEIEINEDESVDIEVDQNEMDQITAHENERKRKRRLTGIFRKSKSKKLESHDDNGENGMKKKKRCLTGVFKKNKSKKKSKSQDGNGENEITQRKSKFGKSKRKKTTVNIESDTNEGDTNTELEDRVDTSKKKRKLWGRISWKSKKEKENIRNEDDENDENIELQNTKTTKQESIKTAGKIKIEKKLSVKKSEKKEKKKDKKKKGKGKEEKKKGKQMGAEKMEIGEKEKT